MIARNGTKSNSVSLSLLTTYFAFRIDYGQLLNGRNGRAYRIAAAGDVSQVNDNTWQVKPSTSGRAPYTVRFNPITHHCPGWSCNCPDCGPAGHAPVMAFCGGTQPVCKHIVAVAMVYFGRIALPRCDCPDAPPAPAQARINGNGRRRTTCEVCKVDWQECECKSPPLPQPARITTLANAGEPLTVAEQKAAARKANGIKQEAGRRIGADFGNPQRW